MADIRFRCVRCREAILDRYLLMVEQRAWHPACLRCAACNDPLGKDDRCFSKDGNMFCATDYAR